VGGVVVDKLLFRFAICGVDAFRRYSRLKSKVVRNRAKFWTLSLLNCWGRAFQKLYPIYHFCLVARGLKKFHEDTPTSPEIIERKTLNFRPNFKFSRLNFLRGQHPLRAEMYSLPKKSTLCSIYIRLNNFFVYGPKYTNFFIQRGRNFRYVDPFRGYSR